MSRILNEHGQIIDREVCKRYDRICDSQIGKGLMDGRFQCFRAIEDGHLEMGGCRKQAMVEGQRRHDSENDNTRWLHGLSGEVSQRHAVPTGNASGSARLRRTTRIAV